MIHIHHTVAGDTCPILPVDVPLNSEQLHFYSEPFEYHMSIRRTVSLLINQYMWKEAIFTVYKGKFQQPKSYKTCC